MNKREQPGNEFVPLVSDALRNRLLHTDLRGLALDDRQRDAVDKQDDVRPDRLRAAGALHAELGGDVEGVAPPVSPVDVLQVEAPGIALDGLLQGRPQRDQVIELLIGLQQAVVLDVPELLDRRLDVLLAEEILAPPVLNPVDLLEPLPENPLQDHLPGLPLPLPERLLRLQVGKPQIHQYLERRDLGEIFLVEAEAVHVYTLESFVTF